MKKTEKTNVNMSGDIPLQKQEENNDENSNGKTVKFNKNLQIIKQERAKKIKNSKNYEAVKTRGGGDCAFHAVFGEWHENEFVCSDVVAKRKIVADAIRNCKLGDSIYQLVIDSISNLIMENRTVAGKKLNQAQQVFKESIIKDDNSSSFTWNCFEKELFEYPGITNYIEDFIDEYIKNYRAKKGKEINKENLRALQNKFFQRFSTCLMEDNNKLKEMIAIFPSLYAKYIKYEQSRKAIDWNSILTDREIINEYANFIEKEREWLLIMELHIIAKVFNISVEVCQKSMEPIIYNPGKEKHVIVYFNGVDHFERMADSTEINKNNKRKRNPEGDATEPPFHKLPRFFRKPLDEKNKDDINKKTFDPDKVDPFTLAPISDIALENRFQDIACKQVMDLPSLLQWMNQNKTCPHCKKADVYGLLKALGYVEEEISEEKDSIKASHEILLEYCYKAIISKTLIVLRHVLIRLSEINIDASDEYGNAAIHFAAAYGDESTLSLLYKFGAQINLPRGDGDTPLHIAVSHGNEVAVSFLLSYGANSKIKNRIDIPFQVALKRAEEEEKQIKLYNRILTDLQAGANYLNEEIISKFKNIDYAHDCVFLAYLLACDSENDYSKYSIINTLEEKTKNPEKNPIYYFPDSIGFRNYNFIKIISKLYDLTNKLHLFNYSTHKVIDRKNRYVYNIETVHDLDENLNVNFYSDKILYEQHLKENINQLDELGKGLLHYASEYNHTLLIALLIISGADINLKEKHNNNTALYLAVASGHIEVVELLVKINLQINDLENITKLANSKLQQAKDKFLQYQKIIQIFETTAPMFDGWSNLNQHFWPLSRTRLHNACLNQDRFAAAYLLQMGAKVDAKDQESMTPLMLAVSGRTSKTKAMLIYLLHAYGADVNARDKYGYTPLHHAIDKSKYHTIKQLLQLGADPNRRYKTRANQEGPNIFNYPSLWHIRFLLLFLRAFNENKYGEAGEGYILHTAVMYYDTRNKMFDGRHVLEALIFTEGVCQYDINMLNEDGESAIFIAVRMQKLDVVRYFVKKGIDVTIRNNKKQDLLELAQSLDNNDLIRTLKYAYMLHAIKQQDIDEVERLIHFGEVDFIVEGEDQPLMDTADKTMNQRIIKAISQEYNTQLIEKSFQLNDKNNLLNDQNISDAEEEELTEEEMEDASASENEGFHRNFN